jgi:branched-subunit amino acid transport protein AzlD
MSFVISHHPCESCTKWNKALSICDPTIIMFLVIISQHPCKHCTKWNKALSICDPTIIMLVIVSQPCEHCTKWSKAFKASIIPTESMQ